MIDPARRIPKVRGGRLDIQSNAADSLLIDDIWIVSQSWQFKPSETFIASSTYYGPNKDGDLEIEPKL